MRVIIEKLEHLLDRWDVDHEDKCFALSVMKTFLRDFVMAWVARGAVGFLPQLLRVLKLERFQIVLALQASFGRAAGRFGLFIALYFGLFKVLDRLIQRLLPNLMKQSALIAGAVSSVALLIEGEGFRWMFAQYLTMRALSCVASNIVQRYPGRLKLLEEYGDAAVFALGSGQAVYSFIVRPDTIDREYGHFLTWVADMDPALIELFRKMLQSNKWDDGQAAKLLARSARILSPEALKRLAANLHAPLSCGVIHPESDCFNRIVYSWLSTFRTVFPMYFSLHLAPPLLFKTKAFLADPVASALRSAHNGVRSSSFMSSYIMFFQTLLCTQRNLMALGAIREEWRYAYWLMGFLASASIFVEKKERRSELALYMLSKGGVAFYRTLVEKKWALNIAGGELILFSCSMAVLMSAHRQAPHTLSSIVSRVLKQFLQ